METSLERILARSHKAEMTAHMANHPDDFDELVRLALSNKQPYSWKAAWLLSNCAHTHDVRINECIPEIIESLRTAPDGQKRGLLNILYKQVIDESQEGEVFDCCIDIWSKVHKIPSVRWSAIRLALKISGKYPELYEEISVLTQEEYLETLSPGIKRSITKSLINFEKAHGLARQ